MPQTVLVTAAHPDDEVLGCGGTIARHATEGDKVHILLMAEGITSRDQKRDTAARQEDLSALAQTANNVGSLLGACAVDMLCFADNRLDTLPLLDVIKAIEARLEQIRPSVVYTHHQGDLNIDHQITHKAAVTACRPYPGQTVRTLLFFEVPSSTNWQPAEPGKAFSPDWFVDISGTNGSRSFLDKKLQALEMYEGETRPFPHARSLEGVKSLALARGAGIGIGAAEAFMLGRKLR